MRLEDKKLEGNAIATGAGIQIYNKPRVVNDVDMYLHGNVEHISHYENMFNCLRSLEEGDTARIWISNSGGLLDSALEIIQSIQDCRGEVVTIVTGECHSAASLIALSSPSLHIGDFATMMIHNASYGAVGKATDVYHQVQHSHTVLRKLMHKFYAGFLSEQEIEDVIAGKELWFDADEIRQRLEQRLVYQEKLIEELQNPPKARSKKKVTQKQVTK